MGDIVLTPDTQSGYHWGRVTGSYTYTPEVEGLPHSRKVEWQGTIQKQELSTEARNSLGSVMTVMALRDELVPEIRSWIGGKPRIHTTDPDIEEPYQFALESHLEDFLVQNWQETALSKNYKVLEDEGQPVRRQFQTDVGIIDILAESHDGTELLVIELKKGQTSDKVVGQTLRYMGFINDQIAEGRKVSGLIIAGEVDTRMRYALEMTPQIKFMKYRLDFQLLD